MNKKMNCLAVLPIFGSVSLLLWLFVKMVKQEVNPYKFHAYFISSALFGFVSILATVLFLDFINSLIIVSDFIRNYGLFAAFIIGGYIMNFFTFTLINKKWNDLEQK